MPCYSPIAARRDGGGGIEFLGGVHEPSVRALSTLRIACGRCIGCRLKYSQMWAIRCVHEASLYDKNCVVTLTYDDKHVPPNGSLDYSHFQGFMKRLRQHRRRFFLKSHFRLKHFSDLTRAQAKRLVELSKVRFFCGGEYGDDNLRPHFHACLFNFDFPDKFVVGRRNGSPSLWQSSLADSLWQMGNVRVGVMDFDSAAYVARYVVKKVYGDLAPDHYRVGEPEELVPEFACMSRRPGIGMPWIRKFFKETLRDISVDHRGKRVLMPRVYLRYVDTIADLSNAREELGKRMKLLDARPARLLAGERIASSRLGLSHRKL